MMGSAMARPASDNGHQVRLIGSPLDDHIIKALKAGKDHPTLKRSFAGLAEADYFCGLKAALDGADVIVAGISSFGVDWFTEHVLPVLPSGVLVVSITKGMRLENDDSLQIFPHHFASKRPDLDFVAVGGPCICFELFDRRHTMVYYCGRNMEAVKKAKKVFGTSYYHIIPSTDTIAVECSVALKNAYAMGVSLAVGLAEREKGITDARGITENCIPGAPDLNPVYNPQAALFAQSCLEMRRLVELLGGNGNMVSGLPGAGDLYVTVFGGRTRRLGTLLGRGMKYSQVREVLSGVTLEAVAIITRVAEFLRRAAKHGKADPKQFPLMMHMDSILNEETPVALDWDAFGDR
jgi:glycerol-3-phosphate dehydrogenase (NAD(P)+)